ncbi:MAG: hypothetical protein KGM24_12910 [Elusimicrobia bacterium]|nr:hypothetical protein [Elusimicrobiota bacterium]
MRKSPRSAAKSPRKSRPSNRTLKTSSPDLSAEDVVRLEQISRRYEEAESAWQRMTAPPEGDETWLQVEEHLLSRSPGDQDRRWKYFSK